MWIVAEAGHYIKRITLQWEEAGWSREKKISKAVWIMRLSLPIMKALGPLHTVVFHMHAL